MSPAIKWDWMAPTQMASDKNDTPRVVSSVYWSSGRGTSVLLCGVFWVVLLLVAPNSMEMIDDPDIGTQLSKGQQIRFGLDGVITNDPQMALDAVVASK